MRKRDLPSVRGMMGRAKLLLQGADIAAEWIAHGELTPEQRAVMVEGGASFLGAIASGDIVSQADYESRINTCAACPSKVVASVRDGVAVSSWCGKPLTPNTESESPTCGCVVVLKCAVGSESCPQGKW